MNVEDKIKGVLDEKYEKKENIHPDWKKVSEVEKTITKALDKLASEVNLPEVPYSVIKNMMKVFKQKYS